MKNICPIIIVAGGSIDREFLKEQLDGNSYSFIIGVDKGLEALKEINIDPNLMVGDFDSADESAVTYFRSRQIEEIKLNPVKDDTDMEFAIRESIRRFPGDGICIIGGTGTRLDHTMANVELLKIGLVADPVTIIELLDIHNRITLLNKGEHFVVKSEQYGRYISLLCYTNEVKNLSLGGMKYNLDKKDIQKGTSLCISNEIVDEVAKISFDEGMMILVEAMD